jgi:hypothetical protein
MGNVIERIRRKESDSENSSDNESNTHYCQEKKNMEFFFKPRDIQNHIDQTFNPSDDQCMMEVDMEMIPDADELMSALMT